MNGVNKIIMVLVLGIFLMMLLVVLYYFTDLFIERDPGEVPIRATQEAILEEIDPTRNMGELASQDLNIPSEYMDKFSPGEKKLSLPESMEISVFAAGLQKPRSLVFDSESNLYVTDIGRGAVILLKDEDKNSVADNIVEVDRGLKNPHGIDLYNNNLYVAEEHQVVVYRNINSNGQFQSKEVLISGLPQGKGHFTRTIHIGPDEKLYLTVGSSCNTCEESDDRRAALIRYDLDGKQEMIVAKGLRNTVGFTFSTKSGGLEIWGVDNGRDHLGDNLPPEEVNILDLGQNSTQHYGWPYCYGDKVADSGFSRGANFCESETIGPRYKLPAHSAPLGITFSEESGNIALPPELQGDAFITLHGSWNRSTPIGYKIVRIDDNGSDEPQDFITGWLEGGEAWGRPVDLRFSSKSELFITDDRAGVIYVVRQK